MWVVGFVTWAWLGPVAASAISGCAASLLISAGIMGIVRGRLALRWPQTEGTIARYWIRQGSEYGDEPLYFPVFVFRDGAGQHVVVLSRLFTDSKQWPRGATVEVRYDPSDPQRAELLALLRSGLWQARFTVVTGVAFAVITVAILLWWKDIS